MILTKKRCALFFHASNQWHMCYHVCVIAHIIWRRLQDKMQGSQFSHFLLPASTKKMYNLHSWYSQVTVQSSECNGLLKCIDFIYGNSIYYPSGWQKKIPSPTTKWKVNWEHSSEEIKIESSVVHTSQTISVLRLISDTNLVLNCQKFENFDFFIKFFLPKSCLFVKI